MPNEGRFTTHEEYTPAVMSGSGEEYERVVRAMYDADIDAVMAADDASMVSDMFFLQYFRDQGLIWTTHALFTMANWVSDPPCDDEGVELPMLFHFSTANTHYELKLRDFEQTRYELYEDDKPPAMNASVTELNEKRKQCAPLPRESDAGVPGELLRAAGHQRVPRRDVQVQAVLHPKNVPADRLRRGGGARGGAASRRARRGWERGGGEGARRARRI